jgi:hypothetical protein
MKTEEITIAVDLDGVLFDFEYEFCRRFGERNRHLYDFHSRYPELDPELIDEFVQSPDTYKELLPLFGGILLVNKAKAIKFHVVILTARPKGVSEITKHDLENYGVKYDDIIYAWDKAKTIKDYNAIYTSHPIRVLVDDQIKNLEKLTDIIGIAWEQPWNEGYYPRARYNPENMKLEIKNDAVTSWKEMWRTEK